MSKKALATAALAGLLSAGFAMVTVASAADSVSDGKSMTQPAKEKHACKGLNSCKGQGADGKNSCKGKGSCATDGSKPAAK